MGLALAGSGVAALATALGALPALFVRRISVRWEDIMLGFGAGVMAAAASFSLILPGVAAARDPRQPAGALVAGDWPVRVLLLRQGAATSTSHADVRPGWVHCAACG
jgi:ZIP family zinc transporter